MAHTFDIRFARSDGLAAFFEAPANSFRWKGAGLLHIDAQGMSIAVKRSLLSLLARHRSQRIPAESIREVFREGEALRVEFATRENARATVPFWARDRATAAQIVQLLPTSRTIEVEDSPGERRPENVSRPLAWMLAAAVALIVGFGTLFINIRRPQLPEPAALEQPEAAAPVLPAISAVAPPATAADAPVERPRVAPEEGLPLTPEQARRKALFEGTPLATPDPVSLELSAAIPDQESGATPPAAMEMTPSREIGAAPPPASTESEAESFVPWVPNIHVGPATAVVPIPHSTLAYDQARGALKLFEERADELENGWREFRTRFEAGELNKQLFIARLESDRERWREVGKRLGANSDLKRVELTAFMATLLAVVDYQMRFLDGYAKGLRTGDQDMITRAFVDWERADEFRESARAFVN